MRFRWMDRMVGIFVLVAGLSCVAPAFGQTVALRDEFDGGLADGWTWINEDPARYSFSSRPGYLRILSQRGGLGTETGAKNFLVREVTGDFIIETRVEFNPTVAAQSAGIVVYVNDQTGVALGLSRVSGDRGVFRGIGYLSSEGTPETNQTTGAFYDEDNAENPNLVHLRLLRDGSNFVSAFSPDGVDWAELTTFVNEAVPETVQIGLGVSNGDFDGCGADCDTTTPADFDFLQISLFEDGGGGGGDDTPDPILQSLTIEGPSVLISGESASFSAIGSYNDGSTQDLTAEASWSVAPPDFATVNGGAVNAAETSAAVQVTLVADVSQTVAGSTVTRTATLVVRIDPAAGPAVPMCGAGASAAMTASFLLMSCLLRRRARF